MIAASCLFASNYQVMPIIELNNRYHLSTAKNDNENNVRFNFLMEDFNKYVFFLNKDPSICLYIFLVRCVCFDSERELCVNDSAFFNDRWSYTENKCVPITRKQRRRHQAAMIQIIACNNWLLYPLSIPFLGVCVRDFFFSHPQITSSFYSK